MTAPLYQKKLLITGGSGFIGSALVRTLLAETECDVLNVDKLTYAAVPGALDACLSHPRYEFVRQDICDTSAMAALFARFRPDSVVHLAAESHVDRSIDGANEFIRTNTVGTYSLLQSALGYWRELAPDKQNSFRYQQISTDEVFGPAPANIFFDEETAFNPSSPYAASKAAADHLVMAWHRTYGLPVLISTCTNNYGPFQFPEKLIPLTLVRAVRGQPIPVYGDGRQERDWIHVDDHVSGLLAALRSGRVGQSYALGSGAPRRNLDVVTAICRLLDELRPRSDKAPHEDLISFVDDRPGHDMRYALDTTKARQELNWQPKIDHRDGIRDAVQWYLQNIPWWEEILGSVYDGERLGLNPVTR